MDFQVNPAKLRAGLMVNGWTELPITTDHALEVAELPPHHADPFDRILIAQARREGWPLIKRDRTLERYGLPVELVEGVSIVWGGLATAANIRDRLVGKMHPSFS